MTRNEIIYDLAKEVEKHLLDVKDADVETYECEVQYASVTASFDYHGVHVDCDYTFIRHGCQCEEEINAWLFKEGHNYDRLEEAVYNELERIADYNEIYTQIMDWLF
jgi:hypothetical protein